MTEKFVFENTKPLKVSWGQFVENDDGTLAPHPEYADRSSIELMLAPGDELPSISLGDRFTLAIERKQATAPDDYLAERSRIHEAAARGPWKIERECFDDDFPILDAKREYIGCSPDDGVRAGFEFSDAHAITDAHNTLPKLIDALGKVLELHRRINLYESCEGGWDCSRPDSSHVDDINTGDLLHEGIVTGYSCAECYEVHWCGDETPEWPCQTVRAVAEALEVSGE